MSTWSFRSLSAFGTRSAERIVPARSSILAKSSYWMTAFAALGSGAGGGAGEGLTAGVSNLDLTGEGVDAGGGVDLAFARNEATSAGIVLSSIFWKRMGGSESLNARISVSSGDGVPGDSS